MFTIHSSYDFVGKFRSIWQMLEDKRVSHPWREAIERDAKTENPLHLGLYFTSCRLSDNHKFPTDQSPLPICLPTQWPARCGNVNLMMARRKVQGTAWKKLPVGKMMHFRMSWHLLAFHTFLWKYLYHRVFSIVPLHSILYSTNVFLYSFHCSKKHLEGNSRRR